MSTTQMTPNRPHRSILTLAALCAGACGTIEPYDPKLADPAEWEPGTSEGSFDIIEAGALRDVEIELADSVPAFRVESYGSTDIEISLRSLSDAADPYLVIEGPLPDYGDLIGPGDGVVFATDDDSGDGTDAQIRVTLTAPGVYRVIAGTYSTLARGELPTGQLLELSSSCIVNCERPTVDAKTLLKRAAASNKLKAVVLAARDQIAILSPDPILAAKLRQQLDDIVASPTFEGIERFPTVPVQGLGTFRPAIGLIPGQTPNPDEVIVGKLTALLGECRPVRAAPTAIAPNIAAIGIGHFADRTFTPCQAAHSKRFAQLLTSLAADNGTAIAYDGQMITTPQDLVRMLISSGHTVEVRDERTFASFIALTIGDDDVRWPVWLDTGIELGVSKDNFVIPAGHSHHAWRIAGPVVDARVMFYLGAAGPAFFAQTSARPAWSGNASVHSRRSGSPDDDEYILHTVDVAGSYLRRVRAESASIAAGLPSKGYGFLGTSTDANAFIEITTRGEVLSFPLLRSDTLENELSLPSDGDAVSDQRDALVRALAMMPHDLKSEHIWDDYLREQLQAASAAVAVSAAVN